MNNIKAIQKLNEEELRLGISGKASWHSDYESSAYVFIGGLPFAMNEGDLVSVFSQCGEIVDCNLMRDTDTGRSRGFAFIGYADQRSTILAVDNFNAAEICGRVIKVDHISQYRLPKEFTEEETKTAFNPTGPDGQGWGDFKRLTKETLETHNTLITDSEALWERNLMQQVRSEKTYIHKQKHEKKDQKTHKNHKKHKKTRTDKGKKAQKGVIDEKKFK